MHGHGPQPIPVVEFSLVDPSVLLPADVANPQAVPFGFNDGKPWRGGPNADELAALQGVDPAASADKGRYIRYLQPMEADLARQVEYDMDEQDQIWLDNYNAERKAVGVAPVSYDVFEILFDKLEKEWFDLNKSIPKKEKILPLDEGKCAICDDGECENSNAIVFCDGCNLAVHQDCYGVPYIPEGQWLCRKCTVSPDKPVSCVLCPNSYGAFKQTTTAQWAHLLCAIWIPDTGVSNTVYMEPIDGVEHISKNRWRLVCYLCRKRVGACIQCANRNCFAAFHVTCARDYGLELKMKQGTERGELRAYCEKHGEKPAVSTGKATPTPQQQRLLALQRLSADGRKTPGLYLPRGASSAGHPIGGSSGPSPLRITINMSKSSKSKLAYKKTYSGGPPLVPAFIVDRVLTYIQKLSITRKKEFLNSLCRYWSLKREARRGAPLLKRLHLEPWTASGSTRQQTELEKARKLELMRLARNDLEQVRMLTEQVRKRERKKLERVTLLRDIVDGFLFPMEKKMRDVLKQLGVLDKYMFFAQPVSRALVPDYYDVIKHPMDWQTMSEKLERHEYLTATDFQDDLSLVINNARRYNSKDSPIHRMAIRIEDAAEPLIAELEKLEQPDNAAEVAKSWLDAVFTEDVVEEMFNYDSARPDGEPTPPPPPVRKVVPPPNRDMINELKRRRDAEVAREKEREKAREKERAKQRVRDQARAAAAGPSSMEKTRRVREPKDTGSESSDLDAERAEERAESERAAARIRDSRLRTGRELEQAKERARELERISEKEKARAKEKEKAKKAASAAKRAAKKDKVKNEGDDSDSDDGDNDDPKSISKKAAKLARQRLQEEKDEHRREVRRRKYEREKEKLRLQRLAAAEEREAKLKKATGGKAGGGSGTAAGAEDKGKKRTADDAKLDSAATQAGDQSSKRPALGAVTAAATSATATAKDAALVKRTGTPLRTTRATVAEGSTPAPALLALPRCTHARKSGAASEAAADAKEASDVLEAAGATAVASSAAEAGVAGETAKATDAESSTEAQDKAQHDLEVTDVDGKASFKLFETGWVLPEGSSRRRSVAPITPSPVLPTATLPDATLAPGESATTTNAGKGKGKERANDDKEDASPPKSNVPAPATPARTAATELSSTLMETNKSTGADTTISLDDDTKLTPGGTGKAGYAAWQQRVAELEPLVQVTSATDVGDGVLVWAKSPGFSFFPAECADPNDKDTPLALIEAKPKQASEQDYFPVLFFDEGRSGAWVKRSDLRLLGENKEFDQLFRSRFAIKSHRKLSKMPPKKDTARTLELLEDAYEWAMTLIESDVEEGQDDAEEDGKADAGAGAGAGAGKRKSTAEPAEGPSQQQKKQKTQ